MGQGELKTKVTADIGPFEAAMTKAEGIAKRTAGGVKSYLSSITTPVAGPLAAAAAGAFSLNAIKDGVKGIYDQAGALSDLSDQTGVSVRNLVILEKQFTDAGLSAADAGNAISKMQIYLESIKDDSSKQGLLRELKVGIAEIMAMEPDKRFERLAKAIAAVESASEKTSAARTIFGKGGVKTLGVLGGPLFSNPDAATAARADLMQRKGPQLDRTGDKGGKLWNRFWGGVTDEIADGIEAAINATSAQPVEELGKEAAKTAVGIVKEITDLPKTVSDFIDHFRSMSPMRAGGLIAEIPRKLGAMLSSGATAAAGNSAGHVGGPGMERIDRVTEHESAGGDPRYYDGAGAIMAQFGVAGPDVRGALPRWREFYEGRAAKTAAFFSSVGKSSTGLGVDTAEASRQMRARFMEDARFTNPLASGAQLNAIANQNMQEARDKARADKIRESINKGRIARGEEALQAPISAQQAAMEAALKAVMDPLFAGQTKTIQATVAR